MDWLRHNDGRTCGCLHVLVAELGLGGRPFVRRGTKGRNSSAKKQRGKHWTYSLNKLMDYSRTTIQNGSRPKSQESTPHVCGIDASINDAV